MNLSLIYLYFLSPKFRLKSKK